MKGEELVLKIRDLIKGSVMEQYISEYVQEHPDMWIPATDGSFNMANIEITFTSKPDTGIMYDITVGDLAKHATVLYAQDELDHVVEFEDMKIVAEKHMYKQQQQLDLGLDNC